VFLITSFVLLGCGSTEKPTTGIEPSEYVLLPTREIYYGYSDISIGELYIKLYIQPKAGQPFLINDFVVYKDDNKNLDLANLQCGLVDESDNEIWFDYAYRTFKDHPTPSFEFAEIKENLYSCIVTAPTAGKYRFTVRYDTRERRYNGPDKITTDNSFTVLP
jgi:hypothetical protein